MKHMNYLNYYLLPLHPLAPSSCPCPPSNALPSLSPWPSLPCPRPHPVAPRPSLSGAMAGCVGGYWACNGGVGGPGDVSVIRQDLRKLGLTVCSAAWCGVEVAQGAGASASCRGLGCVGLRGTGLGHTRVWHVRLGHAELGVCAKKGHGWGTKCCDVADMSVLCTGVMW